jgi:suppressor of ftsI/bilirubin oxidase
MANARRRWLLGAAAAGGLGVLGWQWRRVPAPQEPEPLQSALPEEAPELPYPVAPPGMLSIVDASIPFVITAGSYERDMGAGKSARMLAYEVEQAGRRTYNPVLRIRRGERMHADFLNQLDETSIVHWHGMRVDANNDGNPHYAVEPGEVYRYHIPVRNRAGTCWYHPHPGALTAAQVYRGLASFLIVQDEDDDALCRALDLRLGVTDLALLLQDRRIDSGGRYLREASAADLFLGVLGSTAMVNYLPQAALQVSPRIYRLRLLNGCSSRVLRTAFTHAERVLPFTVIGADGGLLAHPRPAQEAFLAPGERLDVLLDLTAIAAGSEVTLTSLAFDAMRDGLAELCRSPAFAQAAMKNAAGAAAATTAAEPALADGAPLPLLSLHVVPGPAYDGRIPARLSTVPDLAIGNARRRDFLFDRKDLRWSINGARFDMLRTQFSVERDSTEVWTFRNPPDGMPHPVHMHGFPFRMLDRRGSPSQVRRLALDENGLAAAETGWKDTFLLWPGERVRVAIEFAHDYPGEQVYMLHCHNLEHEDQGMMLNVRVVPPRA